MTKTEAAPAGAGESVPEPRWLTLDQQRSWRSYIEGSQVLSEALGRDLEQAVDLSLTEYEVLVRLSEAAEHTMRMSQLADDLAHSRSRITHTVRRMEARRLVRRAACAVDGRGVNCTMTAEGYRQLVEAAPVHVASVRHRLVDVLSEQEFALLGDILGRVAAGIRS